MSSFRAELLAVPPLERDAWVDRRLGFLDIPADDPLPRGCVPYLPSPVSAILAVVEHAPVRAEDHFVDVGSGTGRAARLVHLLTGASVIGLEIQPHLVAAARRAGVPSLQGDAVELVGQLDRADVFFLYCPFSGPRLAALVEALEARARPITICALDVELPARAWLELVASPSPGLAIYRSR